MSIHGNEGNYLAHTQGKRHQTNLARRAHMDAKAAAAASKAAMPAAHQFKHVVRIGKPAYKVTKSREAGASTACVRARCLCVPTFATLSVDVVGGWSIGIEVLHAVPYGSAHAYLVPYPHFLRHWAARVAV